MSSEDIESPTTTETTADDGQASRRGLLALFGALGAATLAACGASAEAAPEQRAHAALATPTSGASTNAPFVVVDTVLGGGNVTTPENRTTGDLALKRPTDMVTSPSPSPIVAVALGCSEAGDYGGGIFYWDPAVTYSKDDGGTIIWPKATNGDGSPNTSILGGWVRVHDGTMNVRWFGAQGGVNGLVTDDTKAIQNAIHAAVALAQREVLIPAGTYHVSDTLVLGTPGLRIVGRGAGQSVIAAAFSGVDKPAVFQVNAIDVSVSHLGITTGAGYSYGWCGFSLNGAARFVLDQCTISYAYIGVTLDTSVDLAQNRDNNWLDLYVGVSHFFKTGIDLWGSDSGYTQFSSASRIRIFGELTGPGQNVSGHDSYGVRLGGGGCTLEGGEIALCKWPVQLSPGGGHTVKDVYVEFCDNGILVTGSSETGPNWVMGGSFAGHDAVIASGSLCYIGLNETGARAADILLPPAVVSGNFSGLSPVMASFQVTPNEAHQITIPANTQNQPILFDVVEWDTHGAGAPNASPGWQFKCPVGGVYRITASVSLRFNANGAAYVSAQRNGADVRDVALYGTANTYQGVVLTANVKCVKGDVLSVGIYNLTSAAITIDPWALWQSLSIEKIPAS